MLPTQFSLIHDQLFTIMNLGPLNRLHKLYQTWKENKLIMRLHHYEKKYE